MWVGFLSHIVWCTLNFCSWVQNWKNSEVQYFWEGERVRFSTFAAESKTCKIPKSHIFRRAGFPNFCSWFQNWQYPKFPNFQGWGGVQWWWWWWWWCCFCVRHLGTVWVELTNFDNVFLQPVLTVCSLEYKSTQNDKFMFETKVIAEMAVISGK